MADSLSGKNNDDMEWMSCGNVFQTIQSRLGNCDIDLFACKNNFKLPKYVSYRPAHKSFSLSLTNLNVYLFPSFSLTELVLQKILQDKAAATIVAPIFHTPWFHSHVFPPC